MTAAGVLTDADRRAVDASVAAAVAGEVPPADDRFRARTGPDGRVVRALADAAAAALEGQPADRVLAWAAAVVPRFAVTSSFGAESAVLLHLLSRVAPSTPVLFLDTGLHFAETITFRHDLARQLGLRVVDVRPDLTVAEQAAQHGDRLWARDPDACCGLRKTLPLRRALAGFDGWASGIRRVQTPERATTPSVSARRHDHRWLVTVAPLAAWSHRDVADYLDVHDLPRHPLVADGYASIGCAPCTSPVAAGQDPRAGRWAGFAGKTECGIHVAADGTVRRRAVAP